MCTVTFIPAESGFYFTSSRDELSTRLTIPPLKHRIDGRELFFPKDSKEGGTWIALSMQGRMMCLLNGAFQKHKSLKFYRKSRGLILLDSFNYDSLEHFKAHVELNNIEPFTLLSLDCSEGKFNSFYEFRWDGEKKYLKELPKTEDLIWSSASLYSQEAKTKREELFDAWRKKHAGFKDKMIFEFHNRAHGLAKSEDILMTGDNDLKTTSITQLFFEQGNTTMKYLDLIDSKESIVKIIKNV